MSAIINIFTRRKRLTPDDIEQTDLARCLNAFDLTLLGIGSTLGAGAYVIAGQVAHDTAGPAVVISFLLAAIASVLAGLCYAEFGARVPKAGSAYVYTYVSVGELLAFVIGWNLILEYVIGAASVARTFSGYFDNLAGEALIPFFKKTFPMHIRTLAPYADPVAFLIVIIVTVLLSIGVKESAKFNNVFTLLNLTVLSFIVAAGIFHDDPDNWNIPADQLRGMSECCGHKSGCGEGGFMPFGINGIIKGAATCFFAFVGFDVIATTGEEAVNPQRTIPIATVASLSVVFCFYFGISCTLTMMAPYYDLDLMAPFAKVFEQVGWHWATYLVSAGAVCALSTSLLGSMFPLPRVILAMARDGLIFRPLAKVSERWKTPIAATLITGLLAGWTLTFAIMAALFDVDALVEMLSIGTLLAYSLVALCVLLLRYECTDDDYEQISSKATTNGHVALLIVLGAVLTYQIDQLSELHSGSVVTLVVVLVIVFVVIGLIGRQPQSIKHLHFKVPLVPYFPCMSMFINIYLMLNLEPLTWIRFSVWMAIGLGIYFAYGVRNSSAKQIPEHVSEAEIKETHFGDQKP